MRRASIIVGALGLLLLLAIGLWLLIVPGLLLKYPSDLNKTAVAAGTFTQYIDTATGAPLARPQTLPLSIQRNLRTVASTGSQATVREKSVERIGGEPQQTLLQSYVIDRGSLKSLASKDAYAYKPGNLVDRSPYYSINLPFGTGSGPYDIWKNEAGRAYAFKQAGPDFRRDGLTVRPMAGRLVDAPVAPYYAALLRQQGLPTQISAQQLGSRLKSLGFDAQAFAAAVLPRLGARDRAAVQPLLIEAVPLRYLVSADARLLIEPKTGAIVSLDRMRQTISVTPDVAGFDKLVAVLAQPRYAKIAAVSGAAAKLARLNTLPPVRVFAISYRQTPASVADFAGYVKAKADGADVVTTTIPLGLGVLAGASLLTAGGLAVAARRRQPQVPEGPHEFPIARV